MKYLGSKQRIARELVNFIETHRVEGQTWVEPFVGGASTIMYASGERIGGDANVHIITLLQALQNGWKPPIKVSKKEYLKFQDCGFLMEDKALWAYIGFCCSYGAKWFGGYADNDGKDRIEDSYYEVMSQVPYLKGIIFKHCDYQNLVIPDKSLIYCDPPYRATTGYGKAFNHKLFYTWCRKMTSLGHTVFMSEYFMPEDFTCVFEKKLITNLGSKTVYERLYNI